MTLIFDLWPWESIGFQTLLRTKYVPSLVKIHWRMLILQCSQGCYAVKIRSGDIDLWPMNLTINRVPDSPKDWVCTKFGQNPLKDVDSRVVTRMLWKDGRMVAQFRWRGDNNWKSMKKSCNNLHPHSKSPFLIYFDHVLQHSFRIYFSEENSWNQLNNSKK